MLDVQMHILNSVTYDLNWLCERDMDSSENIYWLWHKRKKHSTYPDIHICGDINV